ncbi:Rossmann-like and DUF2520 domain-containing protein [soil metagenome]
MPKSLSIIGAGRLGKTLAKLLADSRMFDLQDVMTRSPESAMAAVNFIGAGRPISDYKDLHPADVYLISTPDDRIVSCCDALARTGVLNTDSVVFHCSGALASNALQAASELGAAVASIHPIRSFASPEQVARNFAGTWCGVEGDQRALDILFDGFATIGAQWVSIKPEAKILYHAAAVFASNYLVTLVDVAKKAFEVSGIPPDLALQLIQPLMLETANNIFKLGPEAALSGPIARGDMATVEKQSKVIAHWNRQYGELYDQFAALTVELAARRSRTPE